MKSLKPIFGISIAVMLIGIDFSVVNTAIPVIQHTFNAPISKLQWLISGFGLLYAPLMIIMGRLGDLKGRRMIFYVGLIGLIIFSLGAGLSHSIHFLIAMRLLQGFSASMILPCSMSLATNIFRDEKSRVKALAFIFSMMGIGMAFGPVLGSFIVGVLNWRWIFFINIPLGLFALIICLPILKESKISSGGRIDWLGAFLLIASLTLFLFAISQSPIYGWTSPIVWLPFLLSLLIFVWYIMVERQSDMPLVPLATLANRHFFSGLITFLAGTGPCWTAMFLLPLYLHNMRGLPIEYVGSILFIMTIMTFIAPIIGAQYYAKFGPTRVIATLFFTAIIGMSLFLSFGAHTSIGVIALAFLLFGTGWGLGNAISVPLGISQSNPDDNGLISGALTTLTATSSIVLLTICASLFDYGKQLSSFMLGFRLAFALLVMMNIILLIILIILRQGIKAENS